MAVELHDTETGDYFITANPLEIAALDAGTTSGWQRTGEPFVAYSADIGHTRTLCRLYSGQTFAPKLSHFFAASTSGCAGRAGWTRDGNVLKVWGSVSSPA